MLKQTPEQWTEDLIKNLPGEDDRYEFKSGRILFDNDGNRKSDNDICNSLATEICAFANSFGGTLFLGVKNKNKIIDGIEKFYKGNEANPIKEWLDKKVGTFLEFRLPNYRITELELSDETRENIGDDKVVIAIDVFESELAPHQAKFDNKYYYRQSSNSNPAPHHYLAYLWSRTNQQQSDVVSKWCFDFLNQTIGTMITVEQNLRKKRFNNSEFFSLHSWDSHFASLIADQFLRTFPKISNKCAEFRNKIDEFQTSAFPALDTIVSESKLLEDAIRTLYSRKVEQYPTIQPFSMPYMEVVTCLCGELQTNYRDEEGFALIVRLVSCSLLGAENLSASDGEVKLWQGSVNYLANAVRDDINVSQEIGRVEGEIEKVQRFVSALSEELADFRYELCLKHNATYY